MPLVTQAEDFFTRGCGRCPRFDTPDCATQRWRAELAELRRICLAAGLEETARWGQAAYQCEGRTIALLGARREACIIGFPDAALLGDAGAALQTAGPNSAAPTLLRLHGPEDLARFTPLIIRLLAELQRHAKAGHRPPRRASAAPQLPPELEQTLSADTALAAAFAALTPGRQRGYALVVARAKRTATREALIAKFRPQILAGKGPNDRPDQAI